LIDAHGRVVRHWESEADASWERAELLSNGDLIVLGTSPPEAEAENDPRVFGTDKRYLARYTFDGELLWRRRNRSHHDVEELPDGRLLVLTMSHLGAGGRFGERGVVNNKLSFLSAAGEEESEISLFGAFERGWDGFLIKFRGLGGRPDRPEDILHCNSVVWFHRPELEDRSPLYAVGNVLVSSRNQHTIAILSSTEKRVLWSFGEKIAGQHDAQLLDDGNILVLDNGWPERTVSRLLEIDPLTSEIVWEWRAKEPQHFYTSGRGTVQRLPGGTYLVGNTNSGEAFEITREGEMVWRFLNPARDPKTERRAVLRIHRYAPALIDPLLAKSGER
jgi:hypothetical protein